MTSIPDTSKVTSILSPVMFLHMCGYAMLIPSMPDLLGVHQGAVSARSYGWIQSVTNLAALVCAAALGFLSDTHGRRRIIAACEIFALVGAVLMHFSLICPTDRASGLFIAACVTGVGFRRISRTAQGGLLKAAIIDSEPLATRGAKLGQLMSVMGLGFSLGSSVGGYFGAFRHGKMIVLLISVSISVGNITLGWFGLKDKSYRHPSANRPPKQPVSDVHLLQEYTWWTDRVIIALMLVRSLTAFCYFCFSATFDLFCKERLGLSTEHYGYLMTYVGLCFACVSTSVVPRLIQLGMSESRMLMVALPLIGVGRFVLAASFSLLQVLFGQLLVNIGQALTLTLVASLLSAHAPLTQRGYLLGVSESANAFAGVVAPAVAGIVHDSISSAMPACLAGLACIAASAVWGSILDSTAHLKKL